MKTIGLLGGMSWESTVPYYRQINEAVKARLGGLHSARVQQRNRVVELGLLGPDRADDDAWAAVSGFRRDRLDRRAGRGGECRLAHEVLGRIARDEELGEHDEVSALGGGLRARLAQLPRIAGEVADHGVELGQRDLDGVRQGVRHGPTLWRWAQPAQRGRCG